MQADQNTRPIEFRPPADLEPAPPPGGVAVIGGGLAGVAAAVALAERGVSVVLYEREAQLGGRVRGWPDQLSSGEPFTMERGFHAFFRNYYTVRDLLRRVDPHLDLLRPLDDYPLLGPGGHVESFSGLPKRTPLNLLALLARTRTLSLSDLPRIPPWPTLAMFAYDPARTFADFDDVSAKAFLDALGFPLPARQMLFDIFAHSFFNPEAQLSAAEMLRLFHIYFTGNPEGLVFDVLTVPFQVVWARFERYLGDLGVTLSLGAEVTALREQGQRVVVRARGADGVERERQVDDVVVATEVPGLKALAQRSEPRLAAALGADRVSVTAPFAVWRVWLDRRVSAERAPFAAVGGLGRLDNISVLDHYQDEAQRHAATGGSVVELHAYALERDLDDAGQEALRAELWATLNALYPETRTARVVDQRWLLRADCPAFEPGSAARRPGTRTSHPRVSLAGDYVRLEQPVALMEAAATSGFVAANALLEARGLRPFALRSVPTRGLLSGAAPWLAKLPAPALPAASVGAP